MNIIYYENFTKQFHNPEQSKWLLELGVPADSADLFYDNEWLKIDKDDVPLVIYKTNKFTDYDQQKYAPCWSVGRLIEIYEICFGGYFGYRYFRHTLMEDVLLKIEEQIDSINFSKLEE